MSEEVGVMLRALNTTTHYPINGCEINVQEERV